MFSKRRKHIKVLHALLFQILSAFMLLTGTTLFSRIMQAGPFSVSASSTCARSSSLRAAGMTV